MKLSIEAELVYNFAKNTQVIANLEASRTSDQLILSESFDIEPPTKILFAVGTRVTSRPPHRSVRAQFGHTAPTLGV
jgi:hypothetical protein